MRSKIWLCLFLFVVPAFAKEPKAYQTGTLQTMESVACGTSEKDAKSVAGEVLGTDSGSKKTQQVLCQEYVLQGEHVTYRIRPRDEKHPALLPIGERVQYRIEKDKLMLRTESVDSKEREYQVVTMAPRTDTSSADASAPNHLQ